MFVVASRGLGFSLAYQPAPLDTNGTRAARVRLSTLAAIVIVSVMVIEKRALKWRVAGRDGKGRDRGAVGCPC